MIQWHRYRYIANIEIFRIVSYTTFFFTVRERNSTILKVRCFFLIPVKKYSFSVSTSAWTSSLYIEFEFHRVSNYRVRACIKLDFCSSISSFGSSNTSFSGFFELEFSRVWVLRVKARRVFEFRVARSSTSKYYESVWYFFNYKFESWIQHM